jgi:hypothetical protein
VRTPDWAGPLSKAHQRALAYLTGMPSLPVGARAGAHEPRAALGGPLPERATDPREVVAAYSSASGRPMAIMTVTRALSYSECSKKVPAG